VVVFWPEDLQLVKAGPEGRRRLLDTLLSQLDSQASAQLVRYRHVLEQRNALLHQLRIGGDGRDALTGFTRQLAHLGARVAVARARLVTSFNPLAAAALHDLSERRERLELRYLATYADGRAVDFTEVDAVEGALLDAFNARGAEEVARGVTVLGPHRDDLEILVDGRPARHTASQGQQRSVVLACKLAEVRHLHSITGVAPVIMLDDVLSELDPPRRAALLEVLAGEAPHQVLVTATDTLPAAISAFTDVRHFTVSDGSLTETPAR
jgi:DNA replication and repair protein RecF